MNRDRIAEAPSYARNPITPADERAVGGSRLVVAIAAVGVIAVLGGLLLATLLDGDEGGVETADVSGQGGA
ncbi:MAG: hypothetical protein ACR2P0_20805, partial [Acidimicrobiales bacterium]